MGRPLPPPLEPSSPARPSSTVPPGALLRPADIGFCNGAIPRPVPAPPQRRRRRRRLATWLPGHACVATNPFKPGTFETAASARHRESSRVESLTHSKPKSTKPSSRRTTTNCPLSCQHRYIKPLQSRRLEVIRGPSCRITAPHHNHVRPSFLIPCGVMAGFMSCTIRTRIMTSPAQ